MRSLLCAIIAALALLTAAEAAAEEKVSREFRECPDCPEMVGIPAGKFLMGSPAEEAGRFDTEGPQHWVTLRAFALSKYEVTNEEFLAFLRETGYQPKPCNPILGLTWQSPGRGLAYPPGTVEPPRLPAVCLNARDAEAYIAWLNAKVRALEPQARAGPGPYRLPTEAEWEFAARAGTTSARWWGEAIGSGKANCNGCGSPWDNNSIAPVGSFGANSFGIYDALGNVWQWTADCWNESYVGAPSDGTAFPRGDCGKRVLRGGSWSNLPSFVRSASRIGADAGGKDFDYSAYAGFRLARNLP
ncbi:MAG TPA: formylglycine-generating enzyme family protein [Stellaceae bacterium]|nr:formylglycine-generating enzyme family protein [Stellaceae bacterium]